MVPKFNISVTVTAWFTVRTAAAVIFSSVKINFGTWSAWSGTNFPKIILLAKPYNSFFRHADNVFPNIESFVVILINGSPNFIFRHFEYLCYEFPAPSQGFCFEIIAKGKTAEHFKECTVSGRQSHIINVPCSNTFLTGSHSLAWRSFQSCKVRL